MLRKRKALTQKECENVIKIFDGITTVGTHTDQKRGDKERAAMNKISQTHLL